MNIEGEVAALTTERALEATIVMEVPAIIIVHVNPDTTATRVAETVADPLIMVMVIVMTDIIAMEGIQNYHGRNSSGAHGDTDHDLHQTIQNLEFRFGWIRKFAVQQSSRMFMLENMVKALGGQELMAQDPLIKEAEESGKFHVIDTLSDNPEHKTIQNTINAANPSDLIIIKAGVYRENLHITKPIRIIGVGMVEIISSDFESNIIVDADDSAPVLMKNLMIRREPNTFFRTAGEDMPAKAYCGIYLKRGLLQLQKSHMINENGGCLLVKNESRAEIQGNILSGSSGNAIFVNGTHTSVLVENNEIYGATGNGIEITEGKATISGNKIFNCDKCGIMLYKSEGCVIKKNYIFRNGFSGIEANTVKDQVEIFENRIFENSRSGIFSQNRSDLMITNNIICNNVEANIISKHSAKLKLENNRISSGGSSGLFIMDNCEVHAEGNEFSSNRNYGIEIYSSALYGKNNVLLKNNKKCGLQITHHATGYFKNNQLIDNGVGGSQWSNQSSSPNEFEYADNEESSYSRRGGAGGPGSYNRDAGNEEGRSNRRESRRYHDGGSPARERSGERRRYSRSRSHSGSRGRYYRGNAETREKYNSHSQSKSRSRVRSRSRENNKTRGSQER
eukprot:CAMPEP_0114973616 /NCGR_PEP_ID=MMETSP0216-20121206/1061_1 /TAXON_ID=223996 /ORGANISM="Protocruzia adherens, Strain Boccale" /LENGTH=620 /DNA_ID=CAMNT_0002334143 /DNA_START=245 /DNA_END=2107 /DNA_ORIENTATION=+